MRIITVQTTDVLSKILTDGVYHAHHDPDKLNNLAKPYQYLMETYNYQHWPIFGCPVGYKCEYYGANTENTAMIELEIPDDEVRVQSYYNWVDVIYYMELPKDWINEATYPLEKFFKDTLSVKNIDEIKDVYGIQATFQEIKKEWIIDHKPLSDKFEKMHIGSGGRDILKNLSFYE